MDRNAIVGWARRQPELVDAGLGLVAVSLSTGAVLFGPRSVVHSLGSLDVVLMKCSASRPWPFRRRQPLTVFCPYCRQQFCWLRYSGGNAAVERRRALLVAGLDRWPAGKPRAVSLLACGAVALALLVRSVAAEGGDGLRAENVNPLILLLLATAGGIAVQDRQAYLRALVDRAERAESSRETEAARRVAVERLRIARDLHDSLAHHMAVVNVQTGVAQHLLTSDPNAAGVALDHARTAAGQVLDELGTVLGVLRQQARAGSRPNRDRACRGCGP